MQIQVLSIHRGHELLWNAQQILLETSRKQISAKLRTADIFFILDDNKLYSSENLRIGRWNIWDTGQRKQKLELVSSTSRRGARAAYHDEYPPDFGPRIAYTVSLASDPSRPSTLCRPPIW